MYKHIFLDSKVSIFTYNIKIMFLHFKFLDHLILVNRAIIVIRIKLVKFIINQNQIFGW